MFIWPFGTRADEPKFEIEFITAASTQLQQEIKALANRIAGDEVDDLTFVGLHLLTHSIASIEKDGRDFWFRPASRRECAIAGVPFHAVSSVNRSPLRYFFYETFGWRFTVRVDTGARKGLALHVLRVTSAKDSPVTSLSGAARAAGERVQPRPVGLAKALEVVGTIIGAIARFFRGNATPGAYTATGLVVFAAFILVLWWTRNIDAISAFLATIPAAILAAVQFFISLLSYDLVVAGWENFRTGVLEHVIGAVPLITLSLPVLCIYWCIALCLFHGRMTCLGYRSARQLRPWRWRDRMTGNKITRFIGAAWILKYGHWCVAAVSLVVFVVSVRRGVESKSALEVARGGSVIVIAGFVSVLIGLLEARRTRSDWKGIISRATGDSEVMEENMSEQVDRAQRTATRVSVFISVLGTLVWGYGDQISACTKLPLVHITDSTVTCPKFTPR